jgi:hypothetical protein
MGMRTEERIILKWILKKTSVMVSIGFDSGQGLIVGFVNVVICFGFYNRRGIS